MTVVLLPVLRSIARSQVFFRRNELDDLVIRDHTNGEPIDLRNLRAERLGPRGLRSSDQRGNERGYEARTTCVKQPASRYR